jgi:PP-loop superfamily ATP-utilizing enzyme
MMATLAARFKALGFAYVTLDCEGYRSGSMNETLADRALGASHAHRVS